MPYTPTELTSAFLRRAYGMFPSGVTTVGALIDSTPVGIAASSFTSVSFDPPLVSICVAHSSSTWPTLQTAPFLGISVMAAEHRDIVRQLAAKTGDRFANVSWEASPELAIFVHGSTAWLTCRVENQVQAGDHDIVVLRVVNAVAYPDRNPIVFHASELHPWPNVLSDLHAVPGHADR